MPTLATVVRTGTLAKRYGLLCGLDVGFGLKNRYCALFTYVESLLLMAVDKFFSRHFARFMLPDYAL